MSQTQHADTFISITGKITVPPESINGIDETLPPPMPIEEDTFFTAEHRERLKQQAEKMNEGKSKVITFNDEEWEEFWQETEHSPEQAAEKAKSRAHYPVPKTTG